MRQPLGDITRRINNSQPGPTVCDPNLVSKTRYDTFKSSYPPKNKIDSERNVSNSQVPGLTESHDLIKRSRIPMIPTTPTNSGGQLKSCVGPWRLGKTLGRGSTARVRLARHIVTGKKAAVKIIQKTSRQMSLFDSLTNFEREESTLHESNRFRRMPARIEREVAIMMLIQHPNILKLYDIWENRTEIYLCLEYVDGGELSNYIEKRGRLNEEDAVKYFRQILSAIGFCHSFNICHRDLKPENILLTGSGQIKIADFGMAALHQGPDHELTTSCGSPHYAAPELINGSKYRGNMADIWSMGVILYAMLFGKLPFNVDCESKRWLDHLLTKIKKGEYEMEDEIGLEVKSLIKEMLQVNPKNRITLREIWEHPLLIKYDHLDDLGQKAYFPSPGLENCSPFVLKIDHISEDIFRHLRTMWHTLSEKTLMEALLSEEQNDQKLFYILLEQFRDAQLEKYTPDISYSASDYHHAKPLGLSKNYSTCHLHKSTSTSGHKRQISKFKVISNTADTVRRYNKLEASHSQQLGRSEEEANLKNDRDRANFGKETPENTARVRLKYRRSPSMIHMKQKYSMPPKISASRSSLASSVRSRRSGGKIRAPIGKKRGVIFDHSRRDSFNDIGCVIADSSIVRRSGRYTNHGEVTNDSGDFHRALTTISTENNRSITPPRRLTLIEGDGPSQFINEDVRANCSSLNYDCDESFNRSGNSQPRGNELGQGFKDINYANCANDENNCTGISTFDNWSAPHSCGGAGSVKIELLRTKNKAEMQQNSRGNESFSYLNRLITNIDQLMQPSSPISSNRNHRTTSAPVGMRDLALNRQRASICETRSTDESPNDETNILFLKHGNNRVHIKSGRTTSAPEPHLVDHHRNPRPKSCGGVTIRLVQPSLPCSPVNIPAPLDIRKRSSKSESLVPAALRHDFSTINQTAPNNLSKNMCCTGAVAGSKSHVEIYGDEYCDEINTGKSLCKTRKKKSWFMKASREYTSMLSEGETLKSQNLNEKAMSLCEKASIPQHESPGLAVEPKKRIKFILSRLFKRQISRSGVSLDYGLVDFDESSSLPSLMIFNDDGARDRQSVYEENKKARKVAPRGNWFTKLLNLKPTAKFTCFCTSNRKARKETVAILRKWRCYGIRDIQVDPKRNVVYGKVGEKNYLNVKEVKFATEFLTVTEHGKRSTLSIAYWTLDQGAASSLQLVVENVEKNLRARELLITDERKKKMMIKAVKAFKAFKAGDF